MRLKRKRLSPTIHLKEGRRKQLVAWATEAEEERRRTLPAPCPEEWKKHSCSTEEEACCGKLLILSKEDKGTLCKSSSTFPFYHLNIIKHINMPFVLTL